VRKSKKSSELGERVTIERERTRRELWSTVIQGLTQILTVLAFAVPLYTAYSAIAALAGKTTTVSNGVAYTAAALVGTPSGLAVWVSGRAKSKAQSKELIRLRMRITELENELQGQTS
jgi:hypothetical protein